VSAVGTPGAEGRAVEAALEFAERSPETTRTRTITWQDPLASAEVGAKLTGLEYIDAIAAGEIAPPPMGAVMRFTIPEVEEGRVAFEGEPGEEHYNPIGVVHGGYASTILDSALGSAVHTTLDAGVGYTTLTLETKFVRPITRDTARVRVEAEVVHRGRTLATAEARLVAADTGKLLATGTSTCLIIGG
jgi:uncharacterized protein (TIGR00369 family)